jgi:cysteine desulfurase
VRGLIYLDNAATTPVDPDILDGLRVRQAEHFANPASTHPLGRAAAKALNTARARLARQLGADPSKLIFTGGGTEALGLAMLGSAGSTPKRVAISAAEHSAVRESALRLAEVRGWQVDVIPIDAQGRTTPEAVAATLTADTRIVAVMLANNELGTINDIPAISRVIRKRAPRARIVVDAVQALGKVPVNVRRLDVDCLAITAHKLHGPKGIGALWTRHTLRPVFKGGGQEGGIRGGTQSAPMAWALAEAAARMPAGMAEITRLRDALYTELRGHLPDLTLTGPPIGPGRLGNILHICIPGVPSEPLLNALSAEGLCASAGSACSKGQFSSTLAAMGRAATDGGYLRLSVGRFNQEDELEAAARIVADATLTLRKIYG